MRQTNIQKVHDQQTLQATMLEGGKHLYSGRIESARGDEIFISCCLLTMKLHDNGLTFKCLRCSNPKGNLPYIISACFIQR